ncbi:hypothetical protein H112_07477 [Trichophyton rubrum D6]|uniref:Uncharacterized protein n=3 Tax=Trichophyton TaxID=5550 RepID=A0A178EVC4_TRIRU|nr:hypothetical protein H100_07502 [Trichophyton rubrum MR850]EZF38308.1 hypothetical protein H102_07466 [Trichophyton rubrum CBS 100081]EZF48925.1 hypothetical protein H103_07490 [Trichophyton rubrum CBS 288.86]EZF59574.1 hypothetical protein H104_07438 [Trichophyton rubrum CBS 289.86]EZF70210.1 hypothetical protein H105_07496 [Trichophyton soudanense CBS 452.61]EZF80808.1 hypothetical protein H110_07485 [Trichophyton rubrum MR1448]EZF91459.1 hypothetical protein H113_07544 [Trichophyton rub
MTRPLSASRAVAGRPNVTKPRYALRRRSYPSRTRNQQRQHRLALGGNTRSQKTLTQLNFVLPQDYPRSEDDDGGSRLEAETTDGEESGGPRPKKQTIRDHGRKRKRQKDDRPNGTLTQMVNVDWTLSRADKNDPGEHNPRHSRKRRGVEMETILENVENAVDDEDGAPNPPADNVPKELEVLSAIKGQSCREISAEQATRHGKMLPPTNPVTPRKQIRWVVPSSQSPESPEITLNSPRTPRSINNSPVRLSLASSAAPLFNKRRSLLRFNANDYDSQVVPDDGYCGISAPGSPASVLSSPRAISDPSISFREDINARFNAARRECQTQELQASDPGKPESIVYETDGEAKPESIEDVCPNALEIKGTQKSGSSDQGGPQFSLESNIEQSSQNLPASTYMSDTMSVYYTRQPMSYAFEKFPASQSSKGISESARDTEIIESSQSNLPSIVGSDNQETLAKADPQHGWENTSSTRQNDTQPNQAPSALSPVVQVESSQRSESEVEVEVPGSQALETEIESRRIITCSQLLTESLMESIPGPPAWVPGPHSNDHNDLNDDGTVPHES